MTVTAMLARPVTFVRHNPKLVEVRHNDVHVGWLDRATHKRDGGVTGPRSRYHYWSGIIAGTTVRDTTLLGAKLKAQAVLLGTTERGFTPCN